MEDQDFPALYRSADELALACQRRFFAALKAHLLLLVLAAILFVINFPHWLPASTQLVVLLGALACSIYLFSQRPDRYWYATRAVAESIKTTTWRYVTRAEPFDRNDQSATTAFQQKLKAIIDQNKDVVQALTSHLDAPQITRGMTEIRESPLEERKHTYAEGRIKDQLTWYAKRAAFNKATSTRFFWALICANSLAVLCAVLRISFVDYSYWPTEAFVTMAASLLSWMQAKRFSELASSYALAAHEISLIREQAMVPTSEKAFSDFVGDAENAFSREHTQWVARKDV